MRCPASSRSPARRSRSRIRWPTSSSWRQTCKWTIRSTYQILSRGKPNLENALWTASANVINGTETPKQAAESLQKGLDSWYKPGMYEK